MKRILSIALIATMMLSLMLMTACGGGNPSTDAPKASETPAPTTSTPVESSTPGTSDAKPVEIRVAWWGDTNRHALYQQILDAFVAKFPHVTVVPEPTSWTDYWDKLQVQSAGGNAPDFMGMHPQFASDYINRNVLEPLDGFIADGTISTDGWTETTLGTGRVNGVTYMMAMGVTFSSMFVNEGLMEQVGIDPLPADWTWDDLFTWGKAAREKLDAAGMKNVWVMGDDSSNLNSWRYFVRNRGHEIYTAEGEIGFTVEDAEIYWTMYNELRAAGIVPDAATSTEYFNATLEDSLFSHDKVLLVRVPVNQYKLYCTTFPDKKVGIARHPQAGSYGTEVGEFPEGAHFAVSATTSDDKKLAAAQLMNFWLNTEDGLSIFGLDQGVPANLNLVDAYAPKLDEYQVKIQEFVSMMSNIGTPSTFPVAGASEVDATFRTLGDEVAFGYKEPAVAAKELYEKAVEIVAKNKK